MPIYLNYNTENKILYASVEGNLTLEEFEQSMKEITESEIYSPNVKTLWDLRKLDFQSVNWDFEGEVIAIRKKYPARGDAKAALIVESELGFALTRMYETQAELYENFPQTSMVFKDFAEGEKWLIGEG